MDLLKISKALRIGFCLTLPLKAATLDVELKDVKSSKGTIKYLLFNDKDGYPDQVEKSIRQGSIPASEMSFSLTDLTPGTYALTLIHDENDNGKFDTLLGIPMESFGFSENPVIIFGVPNFKRAAFKLEGDRKLKIKMKHL